MGMPQNPYPVMPVAAIFSPSLEWLDKGLAWTEELLGPVADRSEQITITQTKYYEAEMGSPLFKQLFAFERLSNPSDLGSWKLKSNQLEQTLTEAQAGRKGRAVNIDVGYIDRDKLVLASTKNGPHRIPLGRGIYAEVTLMVNRGSYAPFRWTYPDYQEAPFTTFLWSMRKGYLAKLREI